MRGIVYDPTAKTESIIDAPDLPYPADDLPQSLDLRVAAIENKTATIKETLDVLFGGNV